MSLGLVLLGFLAIGGLALLVIHVGRMVETQVRAKVEAEAKRIGEQIASERRFVIDVLRERIETTSDNLAGLISSLANTAQAERREIMATVQEVLDAEKALGSAVGTLIALTDSIKAKLDAGTPDQATVDAIKAEIDATQAAVADTLTRDTPTA